MCSPWLSGFTGFAGRIQQRRPLPVLSVTLDEAKIAKVPDGTVTLVIGNPIVADVTMLKGSGAMVVTGKGFGETNLIALDAQGNVLDEKTIRVIPTDSTLIVQRGMERESYSCAPQCMPAVQPQRRQVLRRLLDPGHGAQRTAAPRRPRKASTDKNAFRQASRPAAASRRCCAWPARRRIPVACISANIARIVPQ